MKLCSRGFLIFFNMWVFVRTSTNFARLASFQTIEFVKLPVPKALDIFVCQTSVDKAFFTKPSVLEKREPRPGEHELISSPVSKLSARSA